MADREELIAALAAAGCIDLDVAQLARASVAASAAVLDLKARYPSAFKEPFNARTVSEPDYQAHRKNFLRDGNREQQRRRDERELARLQARGAR